MTARGLARTTINQNVGRIRRMFRWAASEELIPATVDQSLATVQETPPTYGNAPGTNKLRAPRKTPGDRYTPDSYRRAITRACDLASKMPLHLRSIPKGAPDAEQRRTEAAEWRRQNGWAPNRLRHTAATKIREQFGLEAASATLGHSHADTTLIYAERPERVALEVAEKVG